MHELSIALSILEIVADESERRGGVRVLTVNLKLGPLSGVVQTALLSAYDLAREASPHADAQLVIEEIPVTIDCQGCGTIQPLASIQDFRCPRCGTPASDVVSGRELEVVSMEIEDGNAADASADNAAGRSAHEGAQRE